MLYIAFFLLLTYYILTHSDISLYYAFHGLTLWYNKMIPSLLPFMILSGTLVQMNLTEKFVSLVHPFLKRVYRCNPNVTYGILIGFLCGFPMGAKITSELLKKGKINESEARFLLAFNNNIGPVYFCTFVIPTLGITTIWRAIIGMYAIPLLYGIFLRYTFYKKTLDATYKTHIIPHENDRDASLLEALDKSIRNGIESISMLCGYMIFFNLLNILPHFFVPEFQKYIAPLLEITGGIGTNHYVSPTYILILLPFGGLSCIAQTNCMIHGTSLSIKQYITHKIVLTLITTIYYILI